MRLALTIIVLLSLAVCATATDIVTTKGKVYRDVTVCNVTPEGIDISHSTGVKFLPFRELPHDIRRKYKYSLAKEKKYKEKLEQAMRRKNNAKKAESSKEPATKKKQKKQDPVDKILGTL